MKVIVWGASQNFFSKKSYYKNMEIMAMVDRNPDKWGKFFTWGEREIQIVPPDELRAYSYDKILIGCDAIKEVTNQLTKEMGIPKEKIITWVDIDNEVAKSVIEKYRICPDEEIQSIIKYYSENGFNIFGTYKADVNPLYQVYRDNHDRPYILFEGKKMYYPQSFSFVNCDGKQYVYNVLREQGEKSPHLYVRNNDEIKEDSVIVDAGVCEGNFALRYVDKAKKIYLIESDPQWIKALKMTFSDYQDKVVICNKFLTRYESENTTTLDELVQEDIDFLKMDIEGAEIDAILGGKNILRKSNARCAICSYHKKNDEENIRYLLETYGYQTSTSEGYMFFPYDENILDTMDFRRGVVYGAK